MKEVERMRKGVNCVKGMGVSLLISLLAVGVLSMVSSCDPGCPLCPSPPLPPEDQKSPEVEGLAGKPEGCSDPGAANYKGEDPDGNPLVELENDDCSCEYEEFRKLTTRENKLNVKNVLVEGYTESRAVAGAAIQVLLEKGEGKVLEHIEEKLQYPVDFQYLYIVTHTGGSEVTDYTKGRYAEFEFPSGLSAPPLINVDNINRSGHRTSFRWITSGVSRW